LRQEHDAADGGRLEDVTAGKIFIGERMVNDVPPKDRDIAMVFRTTPCIRT